MIDTNIKKIQSINFIKHPVFKNDSKLTFFDKNIEIEKIPKIFFLVGDNGSGKTHILKSIYWFLMNKDNFQKSMRDQYDFDDEDEEYDILNYEVDCRVLVDSYMVILKSKRSNTQYYGIDKKHQTKILFDEAVVEFQKIKITGTTSLAGSDSRPSGRYTEKLFKKIPQLLIDIKANDDRLIADFCRKNEGNCIDYNKLNLRFNNFTKAFEEMFDGEKRFKSVLDGNEEKRVVFEDVSGGEVSINSLSTGEKQIVYRVSNLIKDLGNINNGIILIDEPELSLHPKWQQKYVEFLLKTFEGLDIQFIIATHSPYILQGMKAGESVAIKIDRNKKGEIGKQIGYYPNSLKNPSVNLINYLAYGIVDELLHIELFTALQIKLVGDDEDKDGYAEICKFLKKAGLDIEKANESLYKKGQNKSETLPLFIRNKIHHSDNEDRLDFSEEELEKSINIMLDLLK